jgi:hypothetical protein
LCPNLPKTYRSFNAYLLWYLEYNWRIKHNKLLYLNALLVNNTKKCYWKIWATSFQFGSVIENVYWPKTKVSSTVKWCILWCKYLKIELWVFDVFSCKHFLSLIQIENW